MRYRNGRPLSHKAYDVKHIKMLILLFYAKDILVKITATDKDMQDMSTQPTDKLQPLRF